MCILEIKIIWFIQQNYLSDLSMVLKDDVFSFNEFTLECIGILSLITIKGIQI